MRRQVARGGLCSVAGVGAYDKFLPASLDRPSLVTVGEEYVQVVGTTNVGEQP